MKMKIIGVLIVILAIALGLYVGGYLLLVKGVIDIFSGVIAIISACSAGSAIPAGTAWLIGLGVIKFSVSAIVGWLIFLITGFIGTIFIGAGEDSMSKKRLTRLKK